MRTNDATPSAARLERALAESAAWHGAGSQGELAAQVCVSLRELIPCDAAGWNEIDLDGKVVRFHNDPPLDVPVEALNRLIDTHPVLRHALETGRYRTHAISDFLAEDEFHATALYRELYRPLGVEDQLSTAVEGDPSRVVAVALNRGERSFTEGDRRLLELVRPHLATAYRRVTRRAAALERLAALEAGLEQAGQTIVFAANGIVDAPPAAHELLERWFGGVPSRLEAGEYERPDGVLVVREVDGVATQTFLLDERRFVHTERVRQYGLTPREAEVVGLAARGLSNRLIGERLSISSRTVHKHLENVYAKLGTGDRAAAISLLTAEDDD